MTAAEARPVLPAIARDAQAAQLKDERFAMADGN